MSTILVTVILIIFGIAIVTFIIKSLVKAAIIIGIIYLLYEIAFVWSSGTFMNNLHVKQIFSPQVSNSIQAGYQQIAKERSQDSVVQTKEINNMINTTLQQALNSASNQISKINTNQLATTLNNQLKNFNPQVVANALNQAKNTLAQYNMTTNQVQK